MMVTWYYVTFNDIDCCVSDETYVLEGAPTSIIRYTPLLRVQRLRRSKVDGY